MFPKSKMVDISKRTVEGFAAKDKALESMERNFFKRINHGRDHADVVEGAPGGLLAQGLPAPCQAQTWTNPLDYVIWGELEWKASNVSHANIEALKGLGTREWDTMYKD